MVLRISFADLFFNLIINISLSLDKLFIILFSISFYFNFLGMLILCRYLDSTYFFIDFEFLWWRIWYWFIRNRFGQSNSRFHWPIGILKRLKRSTLVDFSTLDRNLSCTYLRRSIRIFSGLAPDFNITDNTLRWVYGFRWNFRWGISDFLLLSFFRLPFCYNMRACISHHVACFFHLIFLFIDLFRHRIMHLTTLCKNKTVIDIGHQIAVSSS